jgi:hypothetical protein
MWDSGSNTCATKKRKEKKKEKRTRVDRVGDSFGICTFINQVYKTSIPVGDKKNNYPTL